MMLMSCSATPSVCARSTSVGPVHGDAGDADGAGDLLAVAAQVREVRVARLLGVLEAAVHERGERVARDAVARARVGERDEHRVGGSVVVERRPQRLEPRALLVERRVAVGDVVDLARERVHGRDRAALRPRAAP